MGDTIRGNLIKGDTFRGGDSVRGDTIHGGTLSAGGHYLREDTIRCDTGKEIVPKQVLYVLTKGLFGMVFVPVQNLSNII